MAGIRLDGRTIDVVWLERANGETRVMGRASGECPTDIHRIGVAELVQALEKTLDQGPARCGYVALALTLDHTYFFQEVAPDLPKEDLEGFLNLRAEREFPFALSELTLARESFTDLDGASRVAVLAARRETLETVQAALAKLKLTARHITVEVCGRPAGEAGEGSSVVLVARESRLDLGVFSDSGIWALRSIAARDASSEANEVASLARELRISIGQLDPNARRSIKNIYLLGSPERREIARKAVANVAKSLGVERAEDLDREAWLEQIVSSSLEKRPVSFNFLPERVDRLQQAKQLLAEKKGRWVASSVAGVVGLTLILLIGQSLWLSGLQRRWSNMESKVGDLEITQTRIRQIRTWFDPDIHTLNVYQEIVKGFPQNGNVTLEELAIRSRDKVFLVGTAVTEDHITALANALRENPEHAEVANGPREGLSPVRFSMDVVRVGGGSDGI